MVLAREVLIERPPASRLFRPFGAVAHDELKRTRGAFGDTSGDFLCPNLELMSAPPSASEKLWRSDFTTPKFSSIAVLSVCSRCRGSSSCGRPRAKARFGSADPAMMDDETYLTEHGGELGWRAMEPNSRGEGPGIRNVADEGRDWYARVGENLMSVSGKVHTTCASPATSAGSAVGFGRPRRRCTSSAFAKSSISGAMCVPSLRSAGK